MKNKFVIDGKLPSLNDYCKAERTGWGAANEFKKRNQAIIRAYIKRSKVRPIKGMVNIEYRFYEPNRKRDKDNISAIAHKFIQDSLVQCKIIKNDSWDYIDGYTDEFYVDKNNPRIEVILHEL